MKIRDRVNSLVRVKASELRPNPKNWRTHPPAQRDAVRGVLAEVGFADALLARECVDGTLMLIDGHLRAETAPDSKVPVLILDVSEAEADKILATHDPLAAMAAADTQRLEGLLEVVETENDALAAVLGKLANDAEITAVPDDATARDELNVSESYQVIVDCDGEQQQREVYERMTGEGFACRVLTI